MSLPPLFDGFGCYCPICKSLFPASEYLREAIEDEKARYVANMVTHYRHCHISSWNKCWGRGGSRYRSGWFGDYDTQKALVNERAKRQIIRKCRDFLLLHKISSEHFAMLQGKDEKTFQLAVSQLYNKNLLFEPEQ